MKFWEALREMENGAVCKHNQRHYRKVLGKICWIREDGSYVEASEDYHNQETYWELVTDMIKTLEQE